MTDEARPYFPMFVDISHKKVVVVGAGTIAKRRIRTLVDFTENLTVIAPEVNPELLELQSQGNPLFRRRHAQPAHPGAGRTAHPGSRPRARC